MKYPFKAFKYCVMWKKEPYDDRLPFKWNANVRVITYMLLKQGKQGCSDRLRSFQQWKRNNTTVGTIKRGGSKKKRFWTGCNALHQTQGMFPVGSIPTVHRVRMPEVSKRWVHLYLMNSLSQLALITIRCRQSLLENTLRTRPPSIYHSPCDVLERSPVVSAIFHERYAPASPPAQRSAIAAGHRSHGN
jgi:hypothetical protein